MRKTSKRARGSVTQAARLQFEMDLLLLKQRTEIEQQTERRRQNHEWKMMLAEKGVFAMALALIISMATFYGNFLVERYKNDTSFQQIKAQTIRASSNEVWGKLTSFEESVGQFDDVIRKQSFNKNFGILRTPGEQARDQANVNRISADTKLSFSNLWKTLRVQEINLGPSVHSVFFRAMQDIAEMRIIYEMAAWHGEKLDKIDYDAIDEVRHDLEKQKKILSLVMGPT